MAVTEAGLVVDRFSIAVPETDKVPRATFPKGTPRIEIIKSAVLKTIAEGDNPAKLLNEWKVSEGIRKHAEDQLLEDGVVSRIDGNLYLNRRITKAIARRRAKGI